jgi:hypothetical protein
MPQWAVHGARLDEALEELAEDAVGGQKLYLKNTGREVLGCRGGIRILVENTVGYKKTPPTAYRKKGRNKSYGIPEGRTSPFGRGAAHARDRGGAGAGWALRGVGAGRDKGGAG